MKQAPKCPKRSLRVTEPFRDRLIALDALSPVLKRFGAFIEDAQQFTTKRGAVFPNFKEPCAKMFEDADQLIGDMFRLVEEVRHFAALSTGLGASFKPRRKLHAEFPNPAY